MPTIEPKFFYANGMEVSASPYDIGLKFLRQGSETPTAIVPNAGLTTDAPAVVLDALMVSMSLAHAKAMIPSLVQLILKYEESFGEVPIPPEFVEKWKQFVRTP